jgi:hypothetical protein
MWYSHGHEVSSSLNWLTPSLTVFCSDREAFQTDNFLWQTRMMDAMLTGLEKSLVGFTFVLIPSS